MHTLINTLTSNETRELSIDELSVVTGSGGHGGNNNGPTWGQLAAVAHSLTNAAGNAMTGPAGMIAELATDGAVNAVKQLAQ